MIDEHPFICFNCEKVGKCSIAPLHTHDPQKCKDFQLHQYDHYEKSSLEEIAQRLGTTRNVLYYYIKSRGWECVKEKCAEKGVMLRREKHYSKDTRYKSHHYLYYIKVSENDTNNC